MQKRIEVGGTSIAAESFLSSLLAHLYVTIPLAASLAVNGKLMLIGFYQHASGMAKPQAVGDSNDFGGGCAAPCLGGESGVHSFRFSPSRFLLARGSNILLLVGHLLQLWAGCRD